jgi:hypothetical protein
LVRIDLKKCSNISFSLFFVDIGFSGRVFSTEGWFFGVGFEIDFKILWDGVCY